MARVSIQGLKKQFGNTVTVSDMNLDIAEGEFVTFLGPSGCGKTTTLRMIAGFIEPTEGHIFFGDMDVTRLPVHKRGTGMVFQRYALFPHMTVAQNVAFGLQMHKVSSSERAGRIDKVLDMVRLKALKDRYPRQLSGGQQQRVAIARALAIAPKVFLLDEPLSNLDAKLRVEVREEIRSLQKRLGLTTVFVTHDQEEALAIADRMAIMEGGRVQQLGTPEELYERPVNLFVADFLGKMNFFEGQMDGRAFMCKGGVRMIVEKPVTNAIKLGVRPERMVLRATPPEGSNSLKGTIESVVYLGSQFEVQVRCNDAKLITLQMSNTAMVHQEEAPMTVGAQAYVCFQAQDCVLFNH